jgi:NADH-quinone oxidoreductase subunit E
LFFFTNLLCALINSNIATTFLKNRLGIGVGETTKDNLFSLHEGECFGACADAPVILVNNHKMFSWMNEKNIDALIRDLSSTETNATKNKEK